MCCTRIINRAEVFCWDATALPLKDSCVDVYVTDMVRQFGFYLPIYRGKIMNIQILIAVEGNAEMYCTVVHTSYCPRPKNYY